MKTIIGILAVVFCLSANAQQYIGQHQQTSSLQKSAQRSGMLFSNTAFDRFAFSLTPSAIFFRAFQFDLSYRFENSQNAIMLSLANVNSNFFGSNEFSDDTDTHFGWSFNLYHKVYLPSVVKSNAAYYFMHGLHTNHIDGTKFMENIFITNPDGSVTLGEVHQSYTFNRIGYNIIVGFETMLNERFFFDVNIGIGARWLLNKPGLELNKSMTQSFYGSAFTGLTPVISTRFGMYIF
jgi:hypothetical protein